MAPAPLHGDKICEWKLTKKKQRVTSVNNCPISNLPYFKAYSWQVGSSLKRRQIEWEPIASRMESVGHEPLVRLPCKKSCSRKGLQRSEDHSPQDLGWKIHGATTAAIGRAVRGRKAVGKTSRAEAQAETRGTRHGKWAIANAMPRPSQSKLEMFQQEVEELFFFQSNWCLHCYVMVGGDRWCAFNSYYSNFPLARRCPTVALEHCTSTWVLFAK